MSCCNQLQQQQQQQVYCTGNQAAHEHQPPHYLHQSRDIVKPASNVSSGKQSFKSRHQAAHIKQLASAASSDAHQMDAIETSQSQVQRKLCAFVYVYAILIITLYVTYAAYYFYQHHSSTSQRQQQQQQQHHHEQASSQPQVAEQSLEQQQVEQVEKRLESKIHLLERYIEVIALDLELTKGRLREREKCACSIGCSFNGTLHADRSTWQSQCDTCTCQSGQISCAPQKCPPTNCDDAIQLPGQCCATCMKRCKHNNATIRHGQKFPQVPTGHQAGEQRKECVCLDGRIKCTKIEPRLQLLQPAGRKRPLAAGGNLPVGALRSVGADATLTSSGLVGNKSQVTDSAESSSSADTDKPKASSDISSSSVVELVSGGERQIGEQKSRSAAGDTADTEALKRELTASHQNEARSQQQLDQRQEPQALAASIADTPPASRENG